MPFLAPVAAAAIPIIAGVGKVASVALPLFSAAKGLFSGGSKGGGGAAALPAPAGAPAAPNYAEQDAAAKEAARRRKALETKTVLSDRRNLLTTEDTLASPQQKTLLGV